jgi:hypothetical protein
MSRRGVAAVVVAAVGLAAVVGLVDYARPQDSQTHVGRFVGDVVHGRAWTTVHRKADAVFGSLATPAVTLLVAGVVLLAVVVWRREVRLPLALRPKLVPAAGAVAVLAVLGSLLNDSGIFVAAAVLLAFLPAVIAAAPVAAAPGDTDSPGDTGRS